MCKVSQKSGHLYTSLKDGDPFISANVDLTVDNGLVTMQCRYIFSCAGRKRLRRKKSSHYLILFCFAGAGAEPSWWGEVSGSS